MASSTHRQPTGAAHAGARPGWQGLWLLLERGTERLCTAMLYASALALFLMMVVMTAYVVSRKLGAPLPGAFYISQELMVVVFCLPLGAVTMRNGHIIFELVDKLFPHGIRVWLRLVGSLAGLLFFAVLSWKAVTLGLSAMRAGEYQQGVLNVHIWPFRLVLAGSLIVFSLAIFVAGMRNLFDGLGIVPRDDGEGRPR